MSENKSESAKKPWYKKKLLVFILFFLLLAGGGLFVLYASFNKLLTQALHKSFNNSLVSDVYELKFENLSVDILLGNIKVYNVVMEPREKPLQEYPYINSSFRLTTDKLMLINVKIFELLNNQKLELDRIEINKPDIHVELNGKINVLFPFKDSTQVQKAGNKNIKKALDAFHLRKFELIDANFQLTNSFKDREFKIVNLNFAFNELYINQNYGMDSLACKTIELTIDSAVGTLLNSGIRHVALKDFKFNLGNLALQQTMDTVMYHFKDFNTNTNSMDVVTADSIFHIAVQSFGLSYTDKSIKISGVRFEPMISEAEMQKRFKYQNTQFSLTVNSLQIINLNFDSLIYKQRLFIDELVFDSVTAKIFKDKTKPIDPKKFPPYLGQQIGEIKLPLLVKKVTVKNSTIVSRERKPDGNYAKVTVNKLNATATNITTLATSLPLSLQGEAWIENTANFKVKLDFDYLVQQFSINASISKFDLKGLNGVLQSYTPVKVNAGIVDEITLSGTAFRTKGTGTMKFLYHDLDVNLQLKEKAQWKNDLGAFAANTVLSFSNPPSTDQPPRIVKYEVDRNMQKGFINIVLKSLFAGLKETVIPSKENRKTHQETKKKWKQNKKDEESEKK